MEPETQEVRAREAANDSIRSNYPIATSDFDYNAKDPNSSGKTYAYSWPLTVSRLDEAATFAKPNYCIVRRIFGHKLDNPPHFAAILNNSSCNPPVTCKFCPLRSAILENGTMDRNFVQQECVARIRYLESKTKGYDIGQEESERMWMEEGFYTRFRNAYRPDKSLQEIFDATVPENIANARKLAFERDPLLFQEGLLIQMLKSPSSRSLVAA
jgi:hypothetical protein